MMIYAVIERSMENIGMTTTATAIKNISLQKEYLGRRGGNFSLFILLLSLLSFAVRLLVSVLHAVMVASF
jgi:hypothetical protein